MRCKSKCVCFFTFKALACKHHALLPPLTAEMEALAVGEQNEMQHAQHQAGPGRHSEKYEWVKECIAESEGKAI